MRSIVGIFTFLGFLGTQVLVQAGPTNRPPVTAQSTTNALSPKEDVLKKRYEEYLRMTPDQRRAKLQARLIELKKKETVGTITPAEKAQLKNLENWMQRKSINLNTNSNPVRAVAAPTSTSTSPAITTNKPPPPLPKKK